MKRMALAAAITVLSVLATAPATGAPNRNALVLPGRGIGRVTLGMTMQQVRAALGQHTFVSSRRNLGFGDRYLELQWGYAAWTVGFQGRPEALSVVRVGTTLSRQRTREGLGAGSRIRDIVRVYPQATCSDWAGLGANSSKERWITVRHPNSARTIFAVIGDQKPSPSRASVVEVMVQRPARGLVERRTRCSANWHRQ